MALATQGYTIPQITGDLGSSPPFSYGDTGTAETLTLRNGPTQVATLTGNCTFSMPTPASDASFVLLLLTGAGSFTATFTGVKWPAGFAPVITTTASRMDLLSFFSDGTNWYGNFAQDYTP